MSGNWTTKALGKNADPERFDNEIVVVLVEGGNAFGDRVYAYVEMTIRSMKDMHGRIERREKFLPSEFGQVLAAGKGTPPEELQEEMRSKYHMIHMPPVRPKPRPSMFQPRAWGYAGEGDEATETP